MKFGTQIHFSTKFLKRLNCSSFYTAYFGMSVLSPVQPVQPYMMFGKSKKIISGNLFRGTVSCYSRVFRFESKQVTACSTHKIDQKETDR